MLVLQLTPQVVPRNTRQAVVAIGCIPVEAEIVEQVIALKADAVVRNLGARRQKAIHHAPSPTQLHAPVDGPSGIQGLGDGWVEIAHLQAEHLVLQPGLVERRVPIETPYLAAGAELQSRACLSIQLHQPVGGSGSSRSTQLSEGRRFEVPTDVAENLHALGRFPNCPHLGVEAEVVLGVGLVAIRQESVGKLPAGVGD